MNDLIEGAIIGLAEASSETPHVIDGMKGLSILRRLANEASDDLSAHEFELAMCALDAATDVFIDQLERQQEAASVAFEQLTKAVR